MRRVDDCKGCSSFAHTRYFTHDAIMDLCLPVAIPPRDFDLCKYTYHELSYLYGLDRPNHPVPALRDEHPYVCQITPPYPCPLFNRYVGRCANPICCFG